MKKILLTFFAVFIFFSITTAQTTFTPESLLKIRRVGDPQISPDGKKVLLTIGDVHFDANRTVTQIYSVEINGSNLTALTQGNSSNTAPRWSPDGNKIAFNTGGQIWVMDADGSNRKQLTNLATGAGEPLWSPDGSKIAFVSEVFPECAGDANCNKTKEEQNENSKVKAIETTRLLFRHWNEIRNKKRTHLFVVSSNGGNAQPITFGDYDTPPYAASSFSDFAFSPDSQQIAYLKNTDRVEAVSTNSDIFVADLSNPNAARNITQNNRGYDASPVFTADGRYIIYRSQTIAGFEADRWRLMRYDRNNGTITEITKGFDLQVEEFVISNDSQNVYFTAGDRGRMPLFAVPVNGGTPRKLLANGFISNLKITPNDQQFVFVYSFSSVPPEIVKVGKDINPKEPNLIEPLTKLNRQFIAQFGLRPPDETEWQGASKDRIHGFLYKPTNFDESKKYPLLVIIHGGPQSAFYNSWGYRWNPQVFANAGYVVFTPNPRGSVGYGQKFVNQVSEDWGGKAFQDITKGVEEIVKLPYVDKDRVGAAGASYGGYMVNWILGHNDSKKFKYKALLSHAGIYNLDSFFGGTEELWFPLYEFKGTPWNNPKQYQKWSPNRFVKNFRTPTMITHGEIDYRVPINESFQLYTALQLNNVETKLLYFPDEGHWILKPQNSMLWYNRGLEWFKKYLRP